MAPSEMTALVLEADFEPRPGYTVSEWERRTRKVREANKVWRNPRIRLETRRVPKPQGKQVLLRVKAVGICGSDVHFVETDSDGYMIYPGLVRTPVVIGHELSGVVEEVGERVEYVKPGDMVTTEEMLWCGECTACRIGYVNHCTRLNDPADMEYGELGFTHDGGMAEYVLIPHEKYLWKINSLLNAYGSEDRAFEAGSLVEPTSVSYHAMFNRAGGFKPGSTVVVWGAGPIGAAAIGLAKAAGASMVIAFDVSPVRRELAKAMGADHVFDPRELSEKGTQPWEKILELTDGEGADMHVEAAGAPLSTLPQMLKSLAIGAKITWIGRAPEETPMYLEVLQVRRAQVYGSQGHSGWGTFRNVIRLMAAGKIDMTRIITSRYPLSQALEAFERAKKRIDGKITIKP